MRISQPSRRTDVPVGMVRYHESHGVLPPPPRRHSRYRSDMESYARRMTFVRHANYLRFIVRKTHELRAWRTGRDMSTVRTAAREKPPTVDRELSERQRILHGRAMLLEAGPRLAPADYPIRGALHGNAR